SAHDQSLNLSATYSHPQPPQIELLHDLYNWSSEVDPKSQVLWLYGRAGVGKSVIAQALCRQLKADGRLGGSFFFKAGHLSRGDGAKLFLTIAHQLTLLESLTAVRENIVRVVEEDPSILSGSFGDQLQRLIIEPCAGNSDRTLVIVIDGLDECEDENIQMQILHSLANISLLGAPLRFLVASRPETHIGDAF
ncbi:hypothetical protein C8F04DRAFT_907826, partial [Mycena alexandri]